jgi:hypothetical protein
MTAVLAKQSLLFVGGLALGLAAGWGFGPAKPAGNSEDGRPPGDRTVTIRCIVEYRGEGARPNRFGGRLVPGPDDDLPGAGPVHQHVQVRIQPNPAKAANGLDDVIVIFRLNSCRGGGDSANPARDRPKPDAK